MYKLPLSARRLVLAGLGFCFAAFPLLAQVSVRSVKVLGTKSVVEIEVEASDRIVPQTQVLTDPDRLVVDFPNAVLSGQVRSQSVDRGEVKDVRVGLFQTKPPVTRVVLDLKSARSYQVFPYGRTVMIKITGDSAGNSGEREASEAYATGGAKLVAATYTTSAEPISIQPEPPQPPLQVSYNNGLLGIHSNKATLSEVLFAVQQRTGADISIAAGAEQERVVADIAPAPAPDVLARLLNGSRFNYLILSAADNPQKLDRVILSTRPEGTFVAPPPYEPQATEQPADEGEPPAARNETNLPPPARDPNDNQDPPEKAAVDDNAAPQ